MATEAVARRRRRRRPGRGMRAAAEAQRRAADSAQDLRAFLQDLRGWERRNHHRPPPGEPLQEYPPIRSKPKKSRSSSPPANMETRISSDNYSAWEKYDVKKACEVVDNIKSTPSLDSKKSEEDKNNKLQIESQHEKERGNKFVQAKKWDEAIACYTNAINLYKHDATYYANRALCHLKKDNLHAAETDCTSALKINPSYAKALLRRSTAREGLGSLRRAGDDLSSLLLLEPGNMVVRRQLTILIARMGTKGKKIKSSPNSPEEQPTSQFQIVNDDESQKSPIEKNENDIEKRDVQEKEISSEIEQTEKNITEKSKNIEYRKDDIPDSKRRNSRSDDVTFQAIVKPPHLRSRKPLVRVSVSEIPKGSSVTAISAKLSTNEMTRIIVKHINKKNLFKPNNTRQTYESDEPAETENQVIHDVEKPSEDVKDELNSNVECSVINDPTECDHEQNKENLLIFDNYEDEVYGVPKSSVQFLTDWRLLKGRDKQRSTYLSAIPPSNIPSIFKNSMEGDIMSEILQIIYVGDEFTRDSDFTHSMPYLIALTNVKRFTALTMFLSKSDKEVISNIIKRCTERENSSEEQTTEIMNKFEI